MSNGGLSTLPTQFAQKGGNPNLIATQKPMMKELEAIQKKSSKNSTNVLKNTSKKKLLKQLIIIELYLV